VVVVPIFFPDALLLNDALSVFEEEDLTRTAEPPGLGEVLGVMLPVAVGERGW